MTGLPVRVTNIRAGRRSPGLAPQHRLACLAVAAACGGEVIGAQLHSAVVEFHPGRPAGGDFDFDVARDAPSAGSTLLALQAIMPALAMAPGRSHVVLRGGTELPWSPIFRYIGEVFGPVVARMGLRFSLRRQRPGWYPAGGGVIEAEVEPLNAPLRPLEQTERGEVTGLRVWSLTEKRLPAHIGTRQCEGVREALGPMACPVECREEHLQSVSHGTSCLAMACFGGGGRGGFTALGRPGLPAESVGAQAGSELADFLHSEAAIDHYLADQLLIYAALAAGVSAYVTNKATAHLRTNAAVVEQLLGTSASITEANGTATVTIAGIAHQPSQG